MLYIGGDISLIEEVVILLGSIFRIGHDLLGHPAYGSLGVLEMLDHAGGVSGFWVGRGIDDELSLGPHLNVVGGLELAIAHAVIFHAHEGGVAVGLGKRSPLTKVALVLLIALHLLFFPRTAALQISHLALIVFGVLADVFLLDALVDAPGRFFYLLGIYLGGLFWGQRLFFVFQLVDGLQVGVDLFLELLLVALVGLGPDKAELVGVGLYLGAVQKIGVEVHKPHVG